MKKALRGLSPTTTVIRTEKFERAINEVLLAMLSIVVLLATIDLGSIIL